MPSLPLRVNCGALLARDITEFCPLLLRPSPILLLTTTQGSVKAEGGHIFNLASVVGGEPIYTGGQIQFNGDKVNLREGEAKRVSGDNSVVERNGFSAICWNHKVHMER